MSGGIHTSVKSYIIAQKTNEDETSTSNSTAADSVVHPPPLSVSEMSMASASYGLNICDGCLPKLSSSAKSMVTTTRAESLPLTARSDFFREHGLFGKPRRIKVCEEKIDEGTQDILVTLKELINATGNFSKKNIIGIGSLGTVYKAQLQGQGKSTVAVKRLSSHFKENIERLGKEINLLYALDHKNIIKLFDYHIEKDLPLLVYEYIENKSLEDALSVDSNTRSLKFTWDIRFNICLGIARGLNYLHCFPRLIIAHMNINAANILLDGNLEPKISDFGLAHLYAEEYQFKVIERKVSLGYMAPEYFQGILTSKADVYSFGVILFEIVSWRKNMIGSHHETEFLLDTAYSLHKQGKILDMVDKTLGTYNARQALTILKLAVQCTSISPNARPTMSDIVSVLLGEKTIEEYFKSSPNDGEKITCSGDLTHVDSMGTTSMDLTSIPSTSSLSTKAKDELESM